MDVQALIKSYDHKPIKYDRDIIDKLTNLATTLGKMDHKDIKIFDNWWKKHIKNLYNLNIKPDWTELPNDKIIFQMQNILANLPENSHDTYAEFDKRWQMQVKSIFIL